jgi:hypothetical protein
LRPPDKPLPPVRRFDQVGTGHFDYLHELPCGVKHFLHFAFRCDDVTGSDVCFQKVSLYTRGYS